VLHLSGFVTVLTLGILSEAFSLSFSFVAFAGLLIVMAGLTYSIKGKVVVRI